MNNPYTYVKEKLLKLNGEYVKFYVTTNSKLPNLLANSGSAVIYHENNGVNYIYVGGELIASGYGVKDKESRDVLQWWADSYNSELSYLYDKNTFLENYAYLSYTGIIQWVNDNFIQSNSDISNTHITLNQNNIINDESQIKTSDILGLFENIQYERLKFADIVYTVIYQYPNSNTEHIVTFLQNDFKTLPVGSIIRKVQMSVAIDLKDSGCSNSIIYRYYRRNKNTNSDNPLGNIASSNKLSTNTSSDNIGNELVYSIVNEMKMGNISKIIEFNNDPTLSLFSINNANFKQYNIQTTENDNVVITDEYFNISINYNLNGDDPNNLFIKIEDGNNFIVEDLELEMNATPKEKYKPFAFSINNSEYTSPIYSTQNIIKEETVYASKEFNITDKDENNQPVLLNIHGVHNIYIVSQSDNEDFRIWKKPDFDVLTSAGHVNKLNLNARFPSLGVAYDKNVLQYLLNPVGEDNTHQLLYKTNQLQGFTLSTLFNGYDDYNDNHHYFINPNGIQINNTYVSTNSFSIKVYAGKHTVLFTLPYMYEVDRIYYVNSEGNEVDMTGYFILCGVQEYISEYMTDPIKRAKYLLCVKTGVLNGSEVPEYHYMSTHTKLYYMYTNEESGFAKNFELIVKLRKLTQDEQNQYVSDMKLRNDELKKLSDDNEELIQGLHFEIASHNQILHHKQYDSEHWYDADVAVLCNIDNTTNIDSISIANQENAFDILNDYLIATTKYL